MNIRTGFKRLIHTCQVFSGLRVGFLIAAGTFATDRLFSQGLVNNGATIVIGSNSNIVIDNNSGNYTSQNGGIFSNTSSGGTITLSGNWINNSANSGFSADGATVIFKGSSPQTMGGANPSKFYKFTASGNGIKTFNSAGSVSSLVSVEPGSTINSNGKLTLLATAGSVSNVAPLLSGAAITGNVNVQSYFTGGSSVYRGTRSISPPINEAGLGNKTYAQLKSFMVITGPGGVNNGFDLGSAASPNGVTLTKYNESATLTQAQFTPVANLSETLTPGQGVFLFYRGNRDGYSAQTVSTSNKINAPFAIPESQVIHYTGPINQGDIKVNLSYTDHPGDTNKGYNLIGNPYPAVIDWESVSRTNVNNEIKIIKAGGGYVTYLNNGFAVIVTPSDATYARYIQPGQAFYTRANSTNASVIFTENSKSVASTPGRLLSTGLKDQLAFKGDFSPVKLTSAASKLLRVNLSDGVNSEETVIGFADGATAEAGFEDAVSFGGSTITLSSFSSDNVKLTVNFMPIVPKNGCEVKLSLSSSNATNLALSFNDLAAIENSDLYLKDSYLNTITNVRENPIYNFSIDKSVAASFGDNRLSLVIPTAVALPVTLSSFTVEKSSNGAALSWIAKSEVNFDRYEIERSVGNNVYVTLGQVAASRSKYVFTDPNPESAINYYRLKQVDKDGSFTYSKTVFLDYTFNGNAAFSIFPNPVAEKLNVQMQRQGSVKLVINDLAGKELKSLTIGKGQPVQANIADLTVGIYLLQIFDNEKNVPLGVTKFMKR